MMNLVGASKVSSTGGFRGQKKSQKSPHPNMWRHGRPGSGLGRALVPCLICDGLGGVHVGTGQVSFGTSIHTRFPLVRISTSSWRSELNRYLWSGTDSTTPTTHCTIDLHQHLSVCVNETIPDLIIFQMCKYKPWPQNWR